MNIQDRMGLDYRIRCENCNRDLDHEIRDEIVLVENCPTCLAVAISEAIEDEKVAPVIDMIGLAKTVLMAD